MRVLALTVLAIAATTATAGLAQNRSGSPAAPNLTQLNRALAAVATAAAQSGVPAATVDHDQGDDHANPRAILKVCNKDTPAAQRAAICPVGVSPD
jgi:hypothetical protein